MPPFRNGESAYCLSANRGKQSLAIDLKDLCGVNLVRQMARHADVLVENFKCGDMQRFGLDYDAVLQGIMSVTGDPDGEPHKVGVRVGKQRLQMLMHKHGIRARGKKRSKVTTDSNHDC